MEVKIDTKEKFNVVTINEPHFSDIIAAELSSLASTFVNKVPPNLVVKMPATISIDETAAGELMCVQQNFYENNASFVICELKAELEQQLDAMDLLEVMNITPTESEAWDIVQMEEIERELLDSEDDVEFNSHGEK